MSLRSINQGLQVCLDGGTLDSPKCSIHYRFDGYLFSNRQIIDRWNLGTKIRDFWFDSFDSLVRAAEGV